MFIWFLILSLILLLSIQSVKLIINFLSVFSLTQEKNKNLLVLGWIKKIKISLESGVVPSEDEWMIIEDYQHSFSKRILMIINELRDSGCKILPTLCRFEELLEFQVDLLKNTHVQSSQAISQCIICLFVTPLFSVFLYQIVPFLSGYFWEWCALTSISFFLCFIGFLWIVSLCEKSMWCGLSYSERSYIMEVLVFFEMVISKINSGFCADQSWVEVLEIYKNHLPKFVVFTMSGCHESLKIKTLIQSLFKDAKSSIYYNLMEGKPCVETLVFFAKNFKSEYRALISHQLELLPIRALKPLFICVAPAIILLIIGTVFFSWNSLSGSVF